MTTQLYGFENKEQLYACIEEMWKIDEKIDKGEEKLSKEDKMYYNTHLSTITRYYNDNGRNWFYRSIVM
jgi:hypothetical protein